MDYHETAPHRPETFLIRALNQQRERLEKLYGGQIANIAEGWAKAQVVGSDEMRASTRAECDRILSDYRDQARNGPFRPAKATGQAFGSLAIDGIQKLIDEWKKKDDVLVARIKELQIEPK